MQKHMLWFDFELDKPLHMLPCLNRQDTRTNLKWYGRFSSTLSKELLIRVAFYILENQVGIVIASNQEMDCYEAHLIRYNDNLLGHAIHAILHSLWRLRSAHVLLCFWGEIALIWIRQYWWETLCCPEFELCYDVLLASNVYF